MCYGPGQLCTKYSFLIQHLKFRRWPCYTGQNKNKSLIRVKGEDTFHMHVKCILFEHLYNP